MNLKIGGSNVGKIMYNGQEFGGATKLEAGTIVHIPVSSSNSIKDAHLFSTTKSWSNIDGIKIAYFNSNFNSISYEADIYSDDFKKLDEEEGYKMDDYDVTVSRSIVDGEYRLNVSRYRLASFIVITAL